MSTRFSDIADWFQTLTPASLERVGEMYAQDAVFIDPFNQLEGLTSVRAVYQHMFDTLKQPRFVVTTIVERERDGFMTWDFLFEYRGQVQQISGCTQFELNDQDLIVLHRDYWDASQQVYEKIPLLGAVLRMIRRKLSLPTTA
jgi:steroid delta-isomerase